MSEKVELENQLVSWLGGTGCGSFCLDTGGGLVVRTAFWVCTWANSHPCTLQHLHVVHVRSWSLSPAHARRRPRQPQECEQEYILNRLQKQVDKLASDKLSLQKVRVQCRGTVARAAGANSSWGASRCVLRGGAGTYDDGLDEPRWSTMTRRHAGYGTAENHAAS